MASLSRVRIKTRSVRGHRGNILTSAKKHSRGIRRGRTGSIGARRRISRSAESGLPLPRLDRTRLTGTLTCLRCPKSKLKRSCAKWRTAWPTTPSPTSPRSTSQAQKTRIFSRMVPAHSPRLSTSPASSLSDTEAGALQNRDRPTGRLQGCAWRNAIQILIFRTLVWVATGIVRVPARCSETVCITTSFFASFGKPIHVLTRRLGGT